MAWHWSGTFRSTLARRADNPTNGHGRRWATLHSGEAAEEVVEGARITRRAFACEVAGDRWPDPAQQLVPSRAARRPPYS